MLFPYQGKNKIVSLSSKERQKPSDIDHGTISHEGQMM